MLIFIKIENEITYYFAGFDKSGHLIGTTNYEDCLHFNLINYYSLSILRLNGFQPSWELD